ncbi:AzlC family ABC transporter permease [Pseudorhodoplanes sp.]|uniref:AzlC family ABC transporter permease n=1 Tax=Pseudorhodoplanes sp. TaxID=1934341 RepID=UPI002D7F03AE|nr:AzlC family ABC transporter permease [Pseudorhodoplanes sp.]
MDFATYSAAFFGGFRSAWLSVFAYVLFGTYVGIGALAYDFNFSLTWVTLSTLVVWAGPAQVILISTLGGGAQLIEVAVAVGLSGVRLLPMVVSLMPLLRGPQTKSYQLLLPAHFTAVSMWVESMRLAPLMPVERRIPFCNGIAFGYMTSAMIATVIGYYLAAQLPDLLTAALLFLTPMSFLVSIARNSSMLVDRLALVLGLVLGPVLAYRNIELDVMWAGIAAGTIAYVAHRIRESLR